MSRVLLTVHVDDAKLEEYALELYEPGERVPADGAGPDLLRGWEAEARAALAAGRIPDTLWWEPDNPYVPMVEFEVLP